MDDEKYGFVYIWRDKKHNRYYIGCHWGTVDDGYVCSSRWMKAAYKNRPEDFRRRILKTGITDRSNIILEEQRYFNMIKPEEIKIRYYNLELSGKNHWHHGDQCLTVGQKISKAKKGVLKSLETKINMSVARRGVPTGPKSPEHKKAISNTLSGRNLSLEHRMAIGVAQLGKPKPPHSPETKEKISVANIGKKWCFDPVTKQSRMLKIIPNGWKIGRPTLK